MGGFIVLDGGAAGISEMESLWDSFPGTVALQQFGECLVIVLLRELKRAREATNARGDAGNR
jgi:hypothetical protein